MSDDLCHVVRRCRLLDQGNVAQVLFLDLCADMTSLEQDINNYPQ